VSEGKSAVAKPCNRGVSMGYGISEINVYLKGVDAHTRRRLRAMKLKQRKRKRFILGYLVKMGVSKARAGKQVFSGRKGIWKLSHIPAVEG
jgi:RNA-directed DNA polymerase